MECCLNFLNIEKNKILRIIFFKISCFLRFMLFPTLKKKKKIGVKKNSGGGGGVDFFFLEKQFFLISRFMLFSTLKKIILKSAPSLTG